MNEALRLSPREQEALEELQRVIVRSYPDARFRIGRGQDDSAAIHLTAIVDLDDPEEALDLVVDRVAALQIEEGLPIFVIPIQPIERVIARRVAAKPKTQAGAALLHP